MSIAVSAMRGRSGVRRPAPRRQAVLRPLPVRPEPGRPVDARPATWTATTRGRVLTVHSCRVARPPVAVAAPSEALLGLQLAGVSLVFVLGIAAVVAAFLGFSDAPLAVLPPA